MPIKIIEGLPVKTRLEAENVFTIDASRAMTQDIRPLRIVILNLMPKKEETELHLLRLLGNTPLQVDIEFLYTETHKSKNTPTSHLQKFYRTLDEIKDERFDGMIITGAPVEKLDFDQVDYIEELETILKWSETHVFSRFFICWGAQFALNHYYDFDKITLPSKLFGIFKYKNTLPSHPLMRGFDDQFEVPQSRHTRMDFSTLDQHPDLKVLSVHPDFGPDILSTSDSRDLYIFGHLEYERDTLRTEYERDVEKGLDTGMPHNYFPDDDSNNSPYFNWKSHGHLLFNNWLNETYQNTYYDLNDLGK